MSNSSTEAEVTAIDADDGAGNAPFAGDTGQLPLLTRRVLVQLLLGPSIDATRQRRLWPILLRDQVVLRSRLHELFLELVIDHEQQVAFTRQVLAEDVDAPILLRKSNLTFLETVLVLFLRQRLTEAEAQGERAVVSAVEMQEHLAVFERSANPDQARFGRQILSAIEKAKRLSLLRALTGAEKRFEVSPTLKLLFSAEQIQALSRTYLDLLTRAQAGEEIASSASDTEEEDWL